MKKFIFLVVALLVFGLALPAYALIRTRNVEVDDYGSGESKFKYKVAYQFATTNVTQGARGYELPIDATITNQLYYTMPFKGSIVGVSIASNADLTAGSVTADVTINGTVTGVRTAINYPGLTRHPKSGLVTAHVRYNAQTLAYDDDSPPDWGGAFHDATHQYGKATAFSVGDRIGVRLYTTSAMAPITSEMTVTVIILQ